MRIDSGMHASRVLLSGNLFIPGLATFFLQFLGNSLFQNCFFLRKSQFMFARVFIQIRDTEHERYVFAK